MTLRIAIVGLMTLASLGLAGCDRVKNALGGHDKTLSAVPEVCANSTAGPDVSADRAAEAKALAAHADTARRDRDTLVLSYQGKAIATIKACDSFYSGSLRLLNPKTRALEAYDVFMTGINQSIIVDHDGTPVLFEGTVIASPDGRYVASGEAHMDYMNADLTLTNWTSATRAQVSFPISCSPKSWTASRLDAVCDRTDPSRFFSDATIAATADGWVLHETKLNAVPEDPRQPYPAHAPDTLQTYVAEIVWPEDNIDWIDAGIYHPTKGAAAPPQLPNMSIALADPQTGKVLPHALIMSDSSYSYRLTIDNTIAYELGARVLASPDGRFLMTPYLNSFLQDWSRRIEINFDDVYCADGKWLSATELQAWCYGTDFAVAHYVEARVTKAANGLWTYREVQPVRKTADHRWQPYMAKDFVPRRVRGKDGREMLNEVPVPPVIALAPGLTAVNHLNT